MNFLVPFIIAILPIVILYLIAIKAKQEMKRKNHITGNYSTRRAEVEKTNNDISYGEIQRQALEKHIEKG